MNYEEIIKGLEDDKIEALLYALGVEEIERKENCLITNTICHNVSGGSMKLYYYFDNHFFYCYTSCEGMSIFKFLQHYYETRDIEYNWYEDIYEVAASCSINKAKLDGFSMPKRESLRERYKKRQAPQLPIFSKGVLNVFSKYYAPEWLSDGITKQTMDKYNIMYSISQNKIIIPHYDINGNLIGIRGRALDEWEIENVGKYMPIKIEQTWYKHSLSMNLYGLNFNKENIKKAGYVYLFESEKAVLQFESFEQPNCAVAVCGSNFNKYQLNLLLKYCKPKEIVICFDKEEKNDREDEYFMKLWKIGDKYKNYCNFSFIYDKEGLLNMKESPSDRGEEIFNALKERRIKIR